MPVLAATSTASFGVTATVEAACQASTPAAAFGSYKTIGTNVSVMCTSFTPYNVSLSAEVTPDSLQKMVASAPALLGYALLSNPAHSVNSGRASSFETVTGRSNEASSAHVTYGQTRGEQSVAPGAYADSITVTVTY